MKARNIILSSLDHARLQDLLIAARQFTTSTSPILDELESELTRATVVPPEEIPPYVVTMNSCVRLIDATTGEEMKHTLTYPSDVKRQKGNISILSELGVAIIGFSAGDTIEWAFPEGVRRLRIDMIYFQPEATRNYGL